MARPSLYTHEVAQTIVERLASGQTLREVCRDDALPAESTIRLWVLEDREGFARRYSQARELGYHSMADEVLEIADDGTNDWIQRRKESGETEAVIDHEHLGRSRLRFDARRWLLSKALPKIYGDRLNVDAKHDVSDQLADLMKAVDGRTRGLPKKAEPE
ncbi:terminase small subunit protein [Tardiphaga sp. 803_E3_N1_3]|uniref:terminase small subunit-like protein n=1 Tax=Tardiphaga sp. 803_E3_N1_3 TaxID=3240785 RepID=UPI003F21BE41